MKILYLVGNGFDINLNMATKYSQFYDYYSKLPSKNHIIANLKENIAKEGFWSDLEIGLGKHTSNLKNQVELDEVFDDIQSNLSEYIKNEEANFLLREFEKDKFIKDLLSPETHLLPKEKNTILNFKMPNSPNKSQANLSIDIISFNYTSTIEKIINYTGKKIELSTNPSCVLRSIEHIHGFHNNRMVLGVNDNTQISNQEFKKNIEIASTLIKSNNNATYGQYHVDNCNLLIKNANIICIFGMSLGDSDNIWWELIGTRMTSMNCILLLFNIGDEFSPIQGHLAERQKNKLRQKFFEKSKLSTTNITNISKNIFVAVNTEMFKLKEKNNKQLDEFAIFETEPTYQKIKPA